MSWTYLCEAGEVAENTLKVVDAAGIRVVVANYGGKFRAMPPVCPHMEEPLEESGIIANCVLTCTKHLWSWDLRSLQIMGPAERPLLTYDIRQEGTRILGLIEQELAYSFEDEANDDDDFFK